MAPLPCLRGRWSCSGARWRVSKGGDGGTGLEGTTASRGVLALFLPGRSIPVARLDGILGRAHWRIGGLGGRDSGRPGDYRGGLGRGRQGHRSPRGGPRYRARESSQAALGLAGQGRPTSRSHGRAVARPLRGTRARARGNRAGHGGGAARARCHGGRGGGRGPGRWAPPEATTPRSCP